MLAGDSGRIALDTAGGPKTMKSYGKAAAGQGRVRTFSVYCPDGTDPDPNQSGGYIAANTSVVYVGPNNSAGFPIAPGGWKDFEDVDPAQMAFIAPAAGQVIFYSFGGTPAGEK